MSKKAAIVAVNPVNGFGLFRYLEAFFENGIQYELFAVADSTRIRTNSGIAIEAHGTIDALCGREAEFDALVFACGDAVPVFAQHADEPWNRTLLAEIGRFAAQGKILAGHCAAALIFELAGVTEGKRLAVHPLAKPAIARGTATDERSVVDGNFYTARDESDAWTLTPALVEALK